ncbi:MAG: PKD-like family lipoprotein [Oscillibacter sp.]|nr:PKD-like family lipoprotein [Oscillibacter sp.]
MKRYKGLSAILLGMSLLFSACYDDEGNYDYDWVQDVFLKNDLRDTTIERGTLFTLRPELLRRSEHGSDRSEPVNPDDYTYAWTTGTSSSAFSKNKDLNDTIWFATGASHQVTYKITEKKSGVSWLYKFNLKVIQHLDKGYLFMTEDEQKRVELELYALNAQGNKVHQTGVLARSGFPYGGGGAHCVANIAVGNAVKNKYLLVATGEGTGWLNLPDFTWDVRQMLGILMVKQYPGVFTIKSAFQLSSSAALYFTAAGNAHVHNTFNIIYSDFAYLEQQKFRAAPYVGGNNYAAILYNEDKRCFCFFPQGNSGFDYPSSFCTNVAENLAYEGSSLIYMQQILNNRTVALIKDKEGKYWKLTFFVAGRPGKWDLALDGLPYELSADIIHMEDADWKVVDCNFKYIYFAKDGKLYNYREGAGINACEPVRVLENGSEVALDEVVSLNVIANNSTGTDFRKKIYIATYSRENKGRVYVVEPESTESRHLIVEEVILLEGKVKSLCNWSN